MVVVHSSSNLDTYFEIQCGTHNSTFFCTNVSSLKSPTQVSILELDTP